MLLERLKHEPFGMMRSNLEDAYKGVDKDIYVRWGKGAPLQRAATRV